MRQERCPSRRAAADFRIDAVGFEILCVNERQATAIFSDVSSRVLPCDFYPTKIEFGEQLVCPGCFQQFVDNQLAAWSRLEFEA
ncbi:hypothetical protein D3H35_00545 [Cohnella faecalis]|uniref:Uncharacterized protein n=1 Tax=Cohnella faecalis TaxID=2315694 RepID=A0A398CTC7_9BACL|nr:hypothetical protein D3H35_00545 [Cohnella faecalis]